jgi:hypothetical protein
MPINYGKIFNVKKIEMDQTKLVVPVKTSICLARG